MNNYNDILDKIINYDDIIKIKKIIYNKIHYFSKFMNNIKIDKYNFNSILNNNEINIIRNIFINQNLRGSNNIINSSFEINAVDKFRNFNSNITNLVIPYLHYNRSSIDGVNIYNFCLYPDLYQPSGSLSSANNNPNLTLNIDDNKKGIIKIFIRKYNMINIMSGFLELKI
jgi:hypothetical protein